MRNGFLNAKSRRLRMDRRLIIFLDLLPSAGITQQVRGVIPIIGFGISQPVQLPQQI